jgi:hypothetical protein
MLAGLQQNAGALASAGELPWADAIAFFPQQQPPCDFLVVLTILQQDAGALASVDELSCVSADAFFPQQQLPCGLLLASAVLQQAAGVIAFSAATACERTFAFSPQTYPMSRPMANGIIKIATRPTFFIDRFLSKSWRNRKVATGGPVPALRTTQPHHKLSIIPCEGGVSMRIGDGDISWFCHPAAPYRGDGGHSIQNNSLMAQIWGTLVALGHPGCTVAADDRTIGPLTPSPTQKP